MTTKTNNSELAIVFSDAHVHTHKQFNENNRRLKNGIALIDYVFGLAAKNNIKYILFPGDMYDLMNVVATEASIAVLQCFHRNTIQYPDITFIAISGNHDQATKNIIGGPAQTALDHLTIFPQFVLIDCDTFVTEAGNTIHGIPYYEYPEDFGATLSVLKHPKEGNEFLLMHQVVASGLPIEDCIAFDDPLLSTFAMVFNGHLHQPKEVSNNFINVGSPMHRDAGDMGNRKGVWLVDLCNPQETLTFKDITDRFPQFILKQQGSELTDWEKEQYVKWYQEPIVVSVSEQKINENFSTNLSPKDILTNYCEAVCNKKELDAKLSYGLSLLV